MSEDTPLIQVNDDDEEEKIDFKQMVWFHGKELASKKSSSLVRLGVGKDGVYKLDSKTAKVLNHWRLPEIKDCNYSGYSFTLQLKTEADYFVRTDDGEAICLYIEAFQKDPEAALEQALSNPPMSQVPESGVLTLRKKFSSEPKSSPANDIKYYTLNRRPKKNASTADPLRDFTHNIEVDSRLRANYNLKSGIAATPKRSRPFSYGAKLDSDSKSTNEISRQRSLEGFLDQTPVNGVKEGEKEAARDLLVSKIALNDKRHSNGILTSPVSTKGEVTMTQSTKSSPHTTSPLTERKMHPHKTPPPLATTHKEIPPPGEAKTQPTERKLPPKPSSFGSDEMTPLLRRDSSSSSGTRSPSSEFRIIRQGPSSSREGSKEPDRVSNSSDDLYDRLEERTSSMASSSSDPTNSRSASAQRMLRASTSPESDNSVYDHLPSLEKSDLETNTPERVASLSPSNFVMLRRNISQPALSTPVSARESPVDRDRSTPSIIEESSDEAGTPTNSDDEIKIGKDEGKAHFEQVKLRDKKRPQHDPFADLLSPKANARLRWSQELNPLYDIIKGFKISDGVKLYDTPSKLLESTRASNLIGSHSERASYKSPSVIVEDEGEYDPIDQRTSPSESVPYSPPGETSRPTSSFSEDTSLSPTHYARKQHLYEDITILQDPKEELHHPAPPQLKGTSLIYHMKRSVTQPADAKKHGVGVRAATLNLGSLEARPLEHTGRSPRIGKRELQQQRRSRTIGSLDDTETVKKQKPVRASDELKDFSFVMREYRMFFIKLPNGILHRQIFSISKPVSELKDRLCDVLGLDNLDNYLLYVEGACLTTVKETDGVSGDLSRINRTGSLTHLVDSQSLPDQGSEPLLLKSNLSLRMQGITTSRIFNLIPDDGATDSSFAFPNEMCADTDDEFPKDWLSIVQGNTPVNQDDAVKLAALQYQAYFLDRTAVHSTVGFCRPTEFLPMEYAGIRGLEQKMYKEQETLKGKNHSEVHEAYSRHCAKLATHNAVFFPAREPRKKLLHSTKLKPVLLGVSSKGILRVDHKTKEVLDFWDFMVLKNWAYSKRTFVLAFANKNYPVECNQSQWISQLVDFHVDSIVNCEPTGAEEEAQKS